MLIHKPSNSLLLRLRNPDKVRAVIPKSRVINYQGHQVTQVHYGLDEVKVLNNLGIAAPSPIHHKYDWAGPYHPMEHQASTSAFFTLNPRSICLNDMGTGKTLSVLWAADYLMDQGKMFKVLIIGPKSTMHPVWADTVSTHFLSKREAVVLHGTKAQRLKRLRHPTAQFFVINHDGIKTILDDLIAANFDAVVLDEAAAFRNAKTKKYKCLEKLVDKVTWLWLLTGTPVPSAPTDAWALGRLLKNGRTPQYFQGFKDATMQQVNPYKWVPRPGAYKQAYDILQPGVRYTKSECIDLPPVTRTMYECDMTKDQLRFYKEMQRELVAEIGGDEITAANAAVKLGKLLQISCGEVYNDEREAVSVDAKPRLDACADLVAAAAQKVIVFVPFTAALDRVAAYLRSKGNTVAVVDGRTPTGKRNKIFHDFQTASDPKVLVAHPNTTAHGLTLTAADTTIWYAPVFSLEIFEQANNRMDRPGQTNHMTVAMIHANWLEREVYAALSRRAHMQDSVLELYKRQVAS